MANTGLVIASDATGPTLSSARFTGPFGNRTNDTTESFDQTTVESVGTYHDLFVRQTGTGTGVITFRINSANGNQTITGAGAGTYHDTTHTDTITAGQKVNFAGTTASTTPAAIVMLFDSTTNFAVREMTLSSGGVAYTSGNNFTSMNGSYNGAGSESKAKARQQQTCVIVNGATEVSANNKTGGTVTVQSRKNGANGNIVITVAASATGIVEDTTHTDSLSPGDDWNYSLVNGADVTHTITFRSMALDYTTSTNNFFIVQASVGADISGTASTQTFCTLGGQFEMATTESATQTNALAAFTYSNTTLLQSIASTNTGTYNFRKNTANGNQTFSFGTAIGNYTDSTHTDTVTATDVINHAVTCGATTAGSFTMVQTFGNFATVSVPLYLQPTVFQWVET